MPVTRLDGRFFSLRTGVAGAIVQKLVQYRRRLAVVGDISGYVAGSNALRDLVYESNRGRQAWFVADRPALDSKLGGSA